MITRLSNIFNFSIFPKDDKKQALLIRRGLYALLGALMHTIICLLLFHARLFRTSGAEFLITFSLMWFGHITFLIALRSGFNKRFRDPGLTLPIMLWAFSCTMYTVYLTNELRSVLLMFYLLTLGFGAFRLNLREYILVTLYGIFLYILTIILFLHFHPRFIVQSREWIMFDCFFMISFAFAFVSAELNNLMKHLQEKNETLNSNLEYIESVSVTDELTGIKNRRFILNVLEQQKLMVERGHYCFSICMFDLDHFKDINDVYGHIVGDSILKKICQTILGTTRKIDYFARIGGEEFLLVFAWTNSAQAYQAAERIRAKIEGIDFSEMLSKTKITISMGVTEYREAEKTEATLARVDTALYAAKRSGRNKVVVN